MNVRALPCPAAAGKLRARMREQFRNWLEDSKLEDYLILIKGSRGMKLETLVEFI